MKQYLPMKPTKRGFRVWVRADAVTGYFCDLEVYVGRESDRSPVEVGLGERVVLQLSECLRGGNYQIYCDNNFTTCHLLDTLLTHNIYGCGTTRSNRRGFPNTLKQVCLERGEHLPECRGGISVDGQKTCYYAVHTGTTTWDLHCRQTPTKRLLSTSTVH